MIAHSVNNYNAGPNNCPKKIEDAMWFTDNQDELKLPANWTPERLDELLERKKFCGKYFCHYKIHDNVGLKSRRFFLYQAGGLNTDLW